MNRTLTRSLRSAIVGLSLLAAFPACAQEAQETNPRAALTSALVAACRKNDAAFARYLTAENAEAFRALPDDQRRAVMGRFVLLGEPGRPLISDDTQGRTVVRCETPSISGEIRIGTPRTRENLAFVPVDVVDVRTTEFGMVREGGGWRILSLGLLLVNIAELSKQWAAQELQSREEDAIRLLQFLADRIRTYREAFGRLPEGLAQLGPPPGNEGVSPDAAKLVDEELAAGAKGGYKFRYRILPAAPEGGDAAFEVAASPAEYGKTGKRSFFLDSSGRLRGADKQGAVATAADPILEVVKRYLEPKP